MAKAPLPFGADQRQDIVAIAAVPDAALKDLSSELSKKEGPILFGSEFRSVVRNHVTERAARLGLWRIAVLLTSLARRSELSRADAIDSFFTGVEAEERLDQSVKAQIKTKRPSLSAIFGSDSVATLSKALDLGLDASRNLSRFHIITDIRPVFDDDRSQIFGAIIMQTLRIDYYTENGPETVSFNVDVRDVEMMVLRLDEAKRKVEAARNFAKKVVGGAVYAAGEEQYDADES